MKQFVKKIIIFCIPFLLMATILFIIPFNKQFGYLYIKGSCFNRGAFIYDRVFENNNPVDVAFIGTSHTLNAINDSLLETTFPNTNFSNIAYCWQGINMEYVLLKDVITQKHPDKIVFEVREREEQISHKMFPYIADNNDIWQQPFLSNPSCFGNVLTALATRVEMQTKQKHVILNNNVTNKKFGFEARGEFASISDLEKSKQVQFNNYNNSTGKLMNDTLSGYTLFYFEKMMQLCTQYNVQIYFIYLPNYGGVLAESINISSYKKYGTVLLPPDSIMNNKNNWANTSHLNSKGAQLLTTWLADNLFNDLP